MKVSDKSAWRFLTPFYDALFPECQVAVQTSKVDECSIKGARE